jgi:predicted nucleic acid-binding protein
MRLLFDTNVIFDVIERRQAHYAASLQMLKQAQHGTIQAAIASHTVANAFYRYKKAAIPVLKEYFLGEVEVVCGNAHQVGVVINLGFSDLEDALQVSAAMAWKAAFIITRNERDFKVSPIPAISPAAFLKRFH